jgi:hypothetical protein
VRTRLIQLLGIERKGNALTFATIQNFLQKVHTSEQRKGTKFRSARGRKAVFQCLISTNSMYGKDIRSTHSPKEERYSKLKKFLVSRLEEMRTTGWQWTRLHSDLRQRRYIAELEIELHTLTQRFLDPVCLENITQLCKGKRALQETHTLLTVPYEQQSSVEGTA